MRTLVLAGGGMAALAQPGLHVEETLLPMDDGVRLNVSVYLPPGPAPDSGWPGIVFVHGLGGSKPSQAAMRAASRGYAGLAYTVRGQGRRPGAAPSGGFSTPVADREAEDLEAVLDWFREKHPVDPAKIGITGASQGGIHSWMAVAHQMGVAAAAPQNFTAEPSNAVVVNGGINPRAIVSSWPRLAYLPATIQMRREAISSYDADRLRSVSARADLRKRLKGSKVPVMVQFAFEDGWGHANNVVEDFLALAGPKKLYLGTGGHGSADVASEREFRRAWIDRWFDRWLKGERNGIEDEPAVTVALLGTWRHLRLPSFPPPGTEMRVYVLEGSGEEGGQLKLEGSVDRLNGRNGNRESRPESLEPRLEHRFDTDFSLADFYDAGGPLRGSNGILKRFRLDSLRYSTGPFEQEFTVVGIPEVEFAVAWESGQRQVAVRIWDVGEDGADRRLVSRGSMTFDKPVEYGHTARIELSATAYNVAAGRSIELEISNLDLDWDAGKQDWRSLRVIPVFALGEITVHSGGGLFSLLRLPEYSPQAGPH